MDASYTKMLIMNKNFYRAFEDKFRGDRDIIKNRFKVYLPFVLPMLQIEGDHNVLDIGCGRGEWLELLREEGFSVKGVDIDELMLEECRKLNIEAKNGDALTYLKSLADSSLTIVSAFHLIEHLTFEILQEVVYEAKRVLIPGGLLIMETPNPENIVVGTSAFYVDPTHIKPIPPRLLEFVVEYTGFKRGKIVRLNQPNHLTGSVSQDIMDILGGVSPDYAVVAQKYGNSEAERLIDNAYSCEYGVTIEELTLNYKSNLFSKITGNEIKLNELKIAINENSSQIADVGVSVGVVNEKIQDLLNSVNSINQILEMNKKNNFRNKIKRILKKILFKINTVMLSTPVIRNLVIALIKKIPFLHQRLLNVRNSQNAEISNALDGVRFNRDSKKYPAPNVDEILDAIKLSLDKKAAPNK